MKTTRSIFRLFGLVSILLFQVSCGKDKYFDPNGGSIKGLVMYQHPLTNVMDTAKQAEVIIQGPIKGRDKGKTISLQTVDGKFEANFLIDGDYDIDIQFLAHERIYSLDTSIRPERSVQRELILKVVGTNDYATASLSGTVQYEDLKNDLLLHASNVEVELLQGNLRFSTTSDDNGKFKFENLPGGSYQLNLSMRDKVEEEPLLYRASRDLEIQPNRVNEQLALALELDKSAIANPLAKIRALDADQARLGGVEVFLYASENALNADPERTKALAKKTSNERGLVFFTHLDKRDYFIHARLIRGNETLTVGEIPKIEWNADHNLSEMTLQLR